jgi:hypothetical protein
LPAAPVIERGMRENAYAATLAQIAYARRCQLAAVALTS